MGASVSGDLLNDSYTRARCALDELSALQLDPTPVNIAVWSAHLAGDKPTLSSAIEELKNNDPSGLTDGALEALYIEHVVIGADQALDIGDAMTAHLRQAAEALSAASNDAVRYGAALDGATSALRSPIADSTLQSLVGGLISATEHMRERTRKLESRLAETSNEVSSLRDNLTRVREEALTDPLTGAANRKRFDEHLEQAISEARATGAPLSLVICDIDHFKQVNDTWGHNTGDQVIRFIASVLSSAARGDHLVARHGGEEFAIVAPNTTLDEAVAIAEEARSMIESKVLRRRTTNETLGSVTASFGVAQLIGNEARWELIERADAALYASKRDGRNRVTCADGAKAA